MSIIEKVQRDNDSALKSSLLLLRLGTLVVLACMLTVHLRSLRLFRWEQSVTGGVVIAYCIAELGLALCAGSTNCRGNAIQVNISNTKAAFLCLNVLPYKQFLFQVSFLLNLCLYFLIVLQM